MSRDAQTAVGTPLLTALGRSIVDYAGTFPPATLALTDAIDHYTRYLSGSNAWMLHRFVVPAEDLNAFVEPRTDSRWSLSVVCREPRDIERARTWRGDGAVIASIETGVLATETELECEHFVERALPHEHAELQALKARGAMLKIRLGGDHVPPASALARAVKACADIELPFKATAGLHEAVRSRSHGFFNLALATTLARAGGDVTEIELLLEESDVASFRFDRDHVDWRHHRFDVPAIEHARRLFRSFGSCSFEEPVESFTALSAR